MVKKNTKWLLLLIAFADVSFASEQFGIRLNKEIRTAVSSVFDGGKPVVIKGDLESSRDLSDYDIPEDELNAEEVAFHTQRNEMVERIKAREVTVEELQAGFQNAMFPIRSGLKPTKLPSREVVLPQMARARFAQPIAVIGNDELSLAWLRLNVEELKRIKVMVLVTEVDSMDQFRAIRSLAPDLQMMPLRADHMLKSVGVSVYPIVLTAGNAYQ